MLTASKIGEKAGSHRNHRREEKLWHDGMKNTLSLGCTVCPDRKTCGGLQVGRPTYDCLDLCCGAPNKCDAVCPNKPREFAQRAREILGFELDNIPRAPQLSGPILPPAVPILYHGRRRNAPFAPPAVCLPLYGVIGRYGGKVRYKDETAVAAAFHFESGTPLILTGVAVDPPLERWWGLGRPSRLQEIGRLRELGVKLVTTPNFSLFTDRPRTDDMHSIKRIGITHEEFLREGLIAALHVNARTERDWERWAEYIWSREEVTHVSFEFGTGSGRAGRINWQTTQLTKLAHDVGRTLHLIVRGVGAGSNILLRLLEAFHETTFLETTSFMKTVKRQRAVAASPCRIRWKRSRTAPRAPLDELLQHNWALVSQRYESVVGYVTVPQTTE